MDTATPDPDADLSRQTTLLVLSMPGCRFSPDTDHQASHSEQPELAELHQALLSANGSDWHDWNALPEDWATSATARHTVKQLQAGFDSSQPVAIRSHLLGRLLPVWQQALTQGERHAVYLLPLCSPQQISTALAAAMPEWQARLLWLRHVLDAEAASRGQARLLLCVDANGNTGNAGWAQTLNRIAGEPQMSAALLAAAEPLEMADLASASRPSAPEPQANANPTANQLTIVQWSEHAWQALQRLCAIDAGEMADQAEAEQVLQQLDTVRSAFDAACSLMGGLLFDQQAGQLQHQQSAADSHRPGTQQADDQQRRLAAELDRAEARIDALMLSSPGNPDNATILAQRDAALLQLNALQGSDAWFSAKPVHWLEQRKPGLVRRTMQLPRLGLWALTGKLAAKRKLQTEVMAIQRAGLFDAAWYISHNADVVLSGHQPLLHWVSVGWREGRDPHPLFDTTSYLHQHPELLHSGTNPLLDYLQAGADGGRRCSRLFDSVWYAQQHAEVQAAGLAPLSHYLLHGAAAGLDPSPLFDHHWYLQQSADVAQSGGNPLMHFIAFGAAAGRDPCPFFSTVWYLQRYPDVAAAGVNPLKHYIEHGATEGRDPGPQFATRWFSAQHAEIAELGENPLAWYLHHPQHEQMEPYPGLQPPVSAQRDSASAILDDSAALSQLLPDWNATKDDCWQTLASGGIGAKPGNSVLVVDEKHPTPDLDSGSFRMRQILACLVGAGLEVVFVGDQQPVDERYVRELQQQGITTLTGRKAALRHLMSRGSAFRAVILSRPASAERYLPLVRAFATNASVIYDTVDLHWVRLQRGAQVADDPTELLASAEHYRRLELANARAADITIAITDEERDTLLTAEPALQVTVVPNIHDIVADVAPFDSRKDLFFIGSYAHPPNVEAMHWLVAEVLPLVVQQLPGVRLRMVGSEMPDEIAALASEHVDAIGYAEDVSAYFQQSRVFVAPLLHGAGMKGKVGQSLSYGLPVVTTSIGAEGIGLEDGVSAMISDDAAGLAQRIVDAYQDPALWQRLSSEGQAVIARRFSPAVVERQILDMLNTPEPQR